MAFWDNALEVMARKISDYMMDERGRRYSYLESMYDGDHPAPLKVKKGQDDNIITNHIGVNVNRSVSRMLRGSVEFALPEGAEAQQEYLDEVWRVNKKDILLLKWALHGAVFGTAYLKIVPDKLDNPLTGALDLFPRLVPLYPDIVRMTTASDDVDDVIQYRIEWTDPQDSREIVYREDTDKQDNDTWIVENSEKHGSAQWQVVSSTVWPYPFAPIVHNQNLPSLNKVYGQDEISDAVNTQNKYNFTMSNTGKIIKHHAHPRTIFKGIGKSQIEMLDDSVDSAIILNNPDADAANLELQSDLVSSREFSKDLKQNMATIMREIDMSAIEQNIGNITNFGLRILYTDAIDKNNTKRMLYGEALEQVNRILLVLAGFEGEQSDPGEIKWGDALVTNILEEIQADQQALSMGIVDKQSVAERSIYKDRYGMDWDDMQERNAPKQTGDPLNAPDAENRASSENSLQGVVKRILDVQKKAVVDGQKVGV